MKVRLIYPRWPKLRNQPEFHLPPHGPVVFAATLPKHVQIEFCDENVQEVDYSPDCDLVCISCMLTCQMPRGYAIADRFRAMGKKVLFGGIGTSLHAEETLQHADCVFLGETEGRMEAVLRDFEQGTLKPVYDFQDQFPDVGLIRPARRDPAGPRALQLPRGADGGPGAYLARMPLQMLPLLRAVFRRAQPSAQTH